MISVKHLYRVLREDEDSQKGLSARNPEAAFAKVSSHVNGLKKSPFISTTKSLDAVKVFYCLAVKRLQKRKEKKISDEVIKADRKRRENVKIEKDRKGHRNANRKISKYAEETKAITIVRIEIENLLKMEDVEIIDLSTENVRMRYLEGNNKLHNYAKKYEEVLIKGFIPAKYVKVINVNALFNRNYCNCVENDTNTCAVDEEVYHADPYTEDFDKLKYSDIRDSLEYEIADIFDEESFYEDFDAEFERMYDLEQKQEECDICHHTEEEIDEEEYKSRLTEDELQEYERSRYSEEEIDEDEYKSRLTEDELQEYERSRYSEEEIDEDEYKSRLTEDELQEYERSRYLEEEIDEDEYKSRLTEDGIPEYERSRYLD